MKTNEIPTNIGEYLKYDETSSTGLRWIKRTGKRNHIGDIAGCVDPEQKKEDNRKQYLKHKKNKEN